MLVLLSSGAKTMRMPRLVSGTRFSAIGDHKKIKPKDTAAFTKSDSFGQTFRNGTLYAARRSIYPVFVSALNTASVRTDKSQECFAPPCSLYQKSQRSRPRQMLNTGIRNHLGLLILPLGILSNTHSPSILAGIWAASRSGSDLRSIGEARGR